MSHVEDLLSATVHLDVNPRKQGITNPEERSYNTKLKLQTCCLTALVSDTQPNFPCFQGSHIQRSLQAVARSLCRCRQRSPQREMQKCVNSGPRSLSL